EQIADRISVFGAIETMDRGPSGIRFVRSRPVNGCFQIRDQLVSIVTGGPRTSGRWHHSTSKLPDHLFPSFGTVADVIEIHFVEHQTGCLRSFVVASNAILIEKSTIGSRSGRRR